MIVLLVIRLLLDPDPHKFVVAVVLPIVLAVGMGVGVVAGLAIFACAQRWLHWIERSLIALFILFIGFFSITFALIWQTRGLDQDIWMLGFMLFAGLAAGVITGSNLRRALRDQGEPVAPKPVVAAAITGLMLRMAVIILFIESVVGLFYMDQASYEFVPEDTLWTLILFTHFAFALVVVFVRLKFWVLLPLTMIVTSPIVAIPFRFPEIAPPVLYLIIGYLALWKLFVLSRCRVVYSALSVLNEEAHYYLID